MTIFEYIEVVVDLIVWCFLWLRYRNEWKKLRITHPWESKSGKEIPQFNSSPSKRQRKISPFPSSQLDHPGPPHRISSLSIHFQGDNSEYNTMPPLDNSNGVSAWDSGSKWISECCNSLECLDLRESSRENLDIECESVKYLDVEDISKLDADTTCFGRKQEKNDISGSIPDVHNNLKASHDLHSGVLPEHYDSFRGIPGSGDGFGGIPGLVGDSKEYGDGCTISGTMAGVSNRSSWGTARGNNAMEYLDLDDNYRRSSVDSMTKFDRAMGRSNPEISHRSTEVPDLDGCSTPGRLLSYAEYVEYKRSKGMVVSPWEYSVDGFINMF